MRERGREHEIKKEEKEQSTRLATLRPDGAPAHPSTVTLFVARPELPSEVQVTNIHQDAQITLAILNKLDVEDEKLSDEEIARIFGFDDDDHDHDRGTHLSNAKSEKTADLTTPKVTLSHRLGHQLGRTRGPLGRGLVAT
ncbi:hypothetical protein G5I_06228 [Acromyrmex echinatior]|uniref:Uncharacterized protein n=1 Tax=Acromyrmex echinatior TaxID=103372 RepID=F4WKE1_ACREC|nr:hypothetical protein G5I_06228 [Acromyrmex echinatior]